MKSWQAVPRRLPAPYDAVGLLRFSLRRFELLFVVASFVMLTGAFTMSFGVSEAAAVDGNSLSQLIFTSIYLLPLTYILVRPGKFARWVLSEPFLLIVVLIALFSTAWSLSPELTVRRSIALLGTTAFGVYLAARFNERRILSLLSWACIIVIAASLISVLWFPSYGMMMETSAGAWRGIFDHKNALGRTMAFTILVFVAVPAGKPTRRWLTLLAIGLASVLLVMSQSVTAFTILLASAMLLGLLRALRWRKTTFIAVGIVCAVAIGIAANLLVANGEAVAEAIGRDVTLTGRTNLWSLSLQSALKRPWFGYGYSAFWNETNQEAVHIWSRFSFQAAHAHNGMLDIVLQLGLVGLCAFLVTLSLAVSRSIKSLRGSFETRTYWPAMYFGFLIFANLTESTFLVRNNLYWTLQVVITLQLCSRLRHDLGSPRSPGRHLL